MEIKKKKSRELAKIGLTTRLKLLTLEPLYQIELKLEIVFWAEIYLYIKF